MIHLSALCRFDYSSFLKCVIVVYDNERHWSSSDQAPICAKTVASRFTRQCDKRPDHIDIHEAKFC